MWGENHMKAGMESRPKNTANEIRQQQQYVVDFPLTKSLTKYKSRIAGMRRVVSLVSRWQGIYQI